SGFSERASCPRGKRRTSMCGPLRVLSADSAATEGPRRSRATATATARINPLWERLRPRVPCIRRGHQPKARNGNRSRTPPRWQVWDNGFFPQDAAMTRKTPLNDAHRALGAKMVDFGGWDMPLNYGSQIEEHHQVRRDAG